MEDRDLTPEEVGRLERELAEEDTAKSEERSLYGQQYQDRVNADMQRHNRALSASRGVAAQRFVR